VFNLVIVVEEEPLLSRAGNRRAIPQYSSEICWRLGKLPSLSLFDILAAAMGAWRMQFGCALGDVTKGPSSDRLSEPTFAERPDPKLLT